MHANPEAHMQETLTFLMCGRDNLDSGGPLHHVTVQIDAAFAEQLWQRMQKVGRERAEDQDFFEMVWSDYRPQWYQEPANWWDFEDDPDHEFHAFQQAIDEATRDTGAGTFFRGPMPDTESVSIEGPKMNVQGDRLYWEGYYSSGVPVWTYTLEKQDLLVARIHLANESERVARFADLVRYSPERAAHVLAHGLDVGVGFEPAPLTGQIPHEVILPLLESSNAKVRQNAILAVGNLERESRTQGRSR